MAKEDVLVRIARFNQNREPERLKLKFKRMATEPFSFFRGTCHLFCEDWPTSTPLDNAPPAWICGDLHLENFGTYKGDNRLAYFDINDFDESALAPITWDLTRFVTSLRLASKLYDLDAETSEILEEAFLTAYQLSILEGKPRWIERATATGLIGRLLRKVRSRTRKTFLDIKTRQDGRLRHLRDIAGKTLEIEKAEKREVERALNSFALTQPSREFFKPLDVKRRIAGTGSLGLRRYVVLVEGRGSPNRNFLIDVKEELPSALESRLKELQPPWDAPAVRVTALQHRLQAIAPALLQPVSFGGRSWSLRELQPVEDRVDLSRRKPKPNELKELVGSFGDLTAWAHLRSSGREGSATTDELIAFAETADWRQEVRNYAKGYVAKATADWRIFQASYKGKAFADLLMRLANAH